MKLNNTIKSIFIATIAISFFSVSCSTDDAEVESTQIATGDSITVDMQYAELIELDQKLLTPNLSLDPNIADLLYTKAKAFIKNYPDNEHIETVMELSAKGAEGIGKKDEAIEILHKMMHEFGTSDKAVVYMYNKARILETIPGKENNAKAAYEEMILKYPDSQLAKDTRFYLDNYFGKSDEEIIQMLESQVQDSVAQTQGE